MIGSIVLAAKVRQKNYESRPAFGVVDYSLAFSAESGAPMKFLDDEVDISYRF